MDLQAQAEIKRIMLKGDRSLKTAKLPAKAGEFDFAVSRAYYAMFYYATAVLPAKGVSFLKHQGLISGFSQHFVKSGVLPADLSKKLRSAFRRRNISDYEYGDEVTGKIVEQTLRDAEDFIKAAKNYLKKAVRGEKP
ncbi:MAG: HEPN domain-containing protein [candidate division WOR-3 bacterium]